MRAFVLLLAAGALGAQSPQVLLERKLGRSPLDALREIGAAKSRDEAKEPIDRLLDRLDGQEQLWLFRLGLGSEDERVVFGTVMIMPEQLAVPELRNAARIVLPRLGDADCPVDAYSTPQLLGSVDMAAIADAVRKLPVADAKWFLGAMHRLVRSENIPSLCELALATKGAVRRAAFANANMGCEYSELQTPLVMTTWLRLIGREPDPETGGVPGVLAGALRARLELPEDPTPPEGQLDTRPPGLPVVACMRWLLASRAVVADLPLLQRVVEDQDWRLRHGALWLLAGLDDDKSLAFLRSQTRDDDDLSLRLALARRGDVKVLDDLLATDSYDAMPAGLAIASPARRRAFAAALLALPPDAALDRVEHLRPWIAAEPQGYEVPPYDDAMLADLEPLAAAAPQLDARVLRAIVAVVPGCATARLADALLAHPATELFAPHPGDEQPEPIWEQRLGDLGYRGEWPFLEVTRPDAFKRRLHEGLTTDQAPVRDICASLLVKLGDVEHLDHLVAWIERSKDPAPNWLLLARTSHAKVVELLRNRVASPAEADDLDALLRALAAAQGMPHEFASVWRIDERDREAVRTNLLGGDPASAFLRSAASTTGVDQRWPPLAAWREARVQTFLRERRRHPELDAEQLTSYDLLWALYAKDGAVLKEAQQLVHDGRYATHYGMDELVRCLGRDLATLPFWIGELGGNCCRACVAEEVMHEFFHGSAWAFDNAWMAEPAVVRLRRRLLPLLPRLRWSRIAEAFVVAGI
jgi:hypothetical protein